MTTAAAVLLAAAFVAPARAAETPSKPSSTLTAKELAAKAVARGTDSVCQGRAIELLGLPQGTNCKTLEFSSEQTSDGAKRKCRVFLSPASDAKPAKPTAMVWSSEADAATGTTEQFFKIGLDGNWQGSYVMQAQLDASGKRVPSSAVYNYLNAATPEGKDALERETNFWLKGMYRKAQAAEKKASRP